MMYCGKCTYITTTYLKSSPYPLIFRLLCALDLVVRKTVAKATNRKKTFTCEKENIYVFIHSILAGMITVAFEQTHSQALEESEKW